MNIHSKNDELLCKMSLIYAENMQIKLRKTACKYNLVIRPDQIRQIDPEIAVLTIRETMVLRIVDKKPTETQH